MITTEGGEVVVAIDPSRNWYVSLARGAAEAQRRGLGLRLAVAVPPRHETPHAGGATDDTTARRAETDTHRRRPAGPGPGIRT
ncbi:hypothetical protein ACFCZ1_05320 [Streptomyces sp. NPDC056224]|uniref:hypothetical protein n=1 Tax=Streptomyces sp. NPDC056224 TaxID=3345750 RepID=UPI0035DF5306